MAQAFSNQVGDRTTAHRSSEDQHVVRETVTTYKLSGRPELPLARDPLAAALDAVAAYREADVTLAPRRPTAEMTAAGAEAAGISLEAAAIAYRAMVAEAES